MENSQRNIGSYLLVVGRYRHGIILGALLMLCALFSLLFAPSASALTTVPTKMNFQGRLTDTSGNIKPNGTYNMKLRLFTVNSGGSAVWTEDRLVSAGNGVTVTNGLFSIQLGSVTSLPASLFASGALYLEVELATPATATSASPVWTEGAMSPRNQMATSAYAYNAETLDGKDSTDFGQLAINNTWTGTNVINVNSASAFDVQNGSALSIFKVDTSNAIVSVVDVAPMTSATVASNVSTALPFSSEFDMEIATDGFARIVYRSASGVNFIQCTNSDCSTNNDTNIDSDTSAGWWPSLTIGSDGFARVSYYTQTGQDLKFVQCTNASCSTKVNTTVDSTGNVGAYSDIDMAADGFARISYSNSFSSDLKFAQCTNAACSTSVITTVDSTNVVAGAKTSMKVGSDGFARISYYDETTDSVKLAQCTNAACSTSVITSVDAGPTYPPEAELILGNDSFPRIVYANTQAGTLRFIQCTNAACSTNVKTVLVSSGSPQDASIAKGSDGFPRISYRKGTTVDLRFIQCTNAACSTNNDNVVDGYQAKGGGSKVAVAPNGYAKIFHNGTVNSVNNTFLTSLVTDSGSEIRTGESLGISQANSFGEIYAKKLDLQGGITIDTTTRSTYGAAIEITGPGEYIQVVDASNTTVLSVTDTAFLYRSDNATLDVSNGAVRISGTSGSGAAVITYDGATGSALLIEGDMGGGGNLLTINNNNTAITTLNIASNGKTTFLSDTIDTDGFSIGTPSATMFAVDTLNSRVRIGPTAADATGIVMVLDEKNTAGDPTGVNGGMYYNSSAGKFRCYQAGAWTDCIGAGGTGASLSANNTWTGTNAFNGSTLSVGGTANASKFSVGNIFNVDTTNNGKVTVLGSGGEQVGVWNTTNSSSTVTWSEAVYANGYVYLTGGGSTDSAINTASVRYAKVNGNGTLGSWTATTSLPAARKGHTAAAANGYLYVLGGGNNSATTTVNYAKLNADGSVGTWQTGTALPAAREDAASITANGYIYVMGGSINNTMYYAKLNADGSVGSWSSATGPVAATNATAVVAHGYVFFIGGAVSSNSVADVYSAKLNANGSLGGWASAGAMPGVRANHVSGVANGYIYAMGGNEESTIYYAKPSATGTISSWTTSTKWLPSSVTGAAGLVVNGYAYYMGGYRFDSGDFSDTYYAQLGGTVNIGGNLNLLEIQGGTLSEGGDSSMGSTGGSITAGNITAAGMLQVNGQANVTGAVSVTGDFNAGNGIFSVENGNSVVRIGSSTADATGIVLVLDTKNTAGDPTGVAGAMYYNSNLGKFRCYEGSAWRDCTNGYTVSIQALSSSPVDATTTYFGSLPKAPSTTAATSKIHIRKAGTIKMAEIYSYSGTAGTGEAWAVYIRKNNSTDTLVASLSLATSERVFTNSSLSIPVAAGDYVEIKSVQPTWVTNPLTTVFGGYLYIE